MNGGRDVGLIHNRAGKTGSHDDNGPSHAREARSTPCDAAGCERLRRIHDRVITELRGVISDELHEELQTLAVRFDQDSPTPSEVRVAQAELVGWLDGLMAGMLVTANTEATTNQTSDDTLASLDKTDAPGLYL